MLLVMLAPMRPAVRTGAGPDRIQDPSQSVSITTKDVPGGALSGPHPWLNAQEALNLWIHPADYQLPDVIGYWEVAAAQHPSDTAPLAALRDLYARQYTIERDPRRRAELTAKRDAVSQRLAQLLGSSTPSQEVPTP
jgi:hypothetical protein